MIEFDIKGNAVDFLIGDEIVTVSAGMGPGYWGRILDALKVLGHDVDPGDLGNLIEFLYFYDRSHLLVDQPERMERMDFFQCPGCGLVYWKHDFTHYDPCDNCRMVA